MICAYILKCADGTYYVGSTSDLRRRLTEHQRGKNKATKFKLPIKLIFKKQFWTVKEARDFEAFVKKQRNRKFYLKLIKGAIV